MFRQLPVFAVALAIVAPAPAFAHAALVKAQPAAGSKVAASPDAITLQFSEGVVPRLCDIAIRDAAGKPVKAAKPAGSGAAVSTKLAAPLPPGTYTVTWRAVSVDSHRTQGRFTFTIAP